MCACLLCCAVLLLLMGSVLCVERCGGVRRARAVREGVLESRARLRCCVRAGVGWMVYCVVRLFAVLWVRRPLSPPDPVVGGPGSGHVVCAVCEAVGAAGAYVSVR